MTKNLVKKILFLLLIIVVLVFVVRVMKEYEVEGEKILPFSISKILLVSTVDGKVTDDHEHIWNVGVTQVNDVYVYIDKTMETDDTIKEIKFENFVINKKPQKGTVKLLRPTGELKNLYTYSEQDYLKDGLAFEGSTIDDMKNMEISNVGGMVGFRFSLEDLGTYVSNEDSEITYDGKLLSNLGVSVEEIKFDVNFDVIITTNEDISFKGTLHLDLPLDTVIEEGSPSKEITNFDNIVFKRV